MRTSIHPFSLFVWAFVVLCGLVWLYANSSLAQADEWCIVTGVMWVWFLGILAFIASIYYRTAHLNLTATVLQEILRGKVQKTILLTDIQKIGVREDSNPNPEMEIDEFIVIASHNQEIVFRPTEWNNTIPFLNTLLQQLKAQGIHVITNERLEEYINSY